MNEHTFRNTIKTQAQRFDPDMLVWKINDDYAGGVPDFFFECEHTERWVESKYIKELPKRPTTIIDLMKSDKYLSNLQQEWLERREQRYGDAVVLVGIGKDRCEGVVVLSHFDWIYPRSTNEFRQLTRPPKEMFPLIFT